VASEFVVFVPAPVPAWPAMILVSPLASVEDLACLAVLRNYKLESNDKEHVIQNWNILTIYNFVKHFRERTKNFFLRLKKSAICHAPPKKFNVENVSS
jgi:hypothetical protein